MEIRIRNCFSMRFNWAHTVGSVIGAAKAAEASGWMLDISRFSEGITIDEEGMTLYLVKISDKDESPPSVQELLASAAFSDYKRSTAKKRISVNG